ncbi:MAG: DNA translocase FtsK [Oscillospiraceae bacterium]|nr:DNA translocase FtsK [Oscillospiraceae bacterium]
MANKSGAKKPATKSTAKKTTASKSNAKTATGKKRGRPSKQTKKKADINRAWSIVMFAFGLILTAMAFVPGEKFWAYLRLNFLLGVFGFSSYFIGPVLLYIGALTVSDKPVKLKMFWATGFILLLSNFMQIFFIGDPPGADIAEKLIALHTLGKTTVFSGGAVSCTLALPLQAAFGAAASKIIILVLTVTFFMFLTDTTPYDIYIKMKEKAAEEKELLAQQMEASRAAKAERQREKERKRAEAEQLRLEAEKERQILEATKPKFRNKKIDFEIDDKPSVDVLEEVPDFAEVDVEEKVQQTFDDVKEEKSIEQQKIDEIMKKLNLSHSNDSAEQTKKEATEKTLTEIEKAKNTLTEREKAAIVPVSEMAPELAPEDKAYIYKHPPIDLFEKGGINNRGDVENELKSNAKKLVDTLESFGVQTRIIDISRGPAVTRYELQPLAGVKISKITNLADDIALNLAASGVRIEAPIPNKAAVGIEVPNKKGSSVNIRTIFESRQFRNATSPLTIALGMDIAGNVVTTDLTRMPHLLIAGSTGSGKSVCVNAIITSFLYKSSPEDVKLILIDPKVVELAEYNGIPHLMMPVVTEPKKAAGALGGAVAEMEKRYRLFAENSVRDIKSFNRLAAAQPELALEKMPYIAVIIDELADLMMVAGKEVEDYICRLAQKARAAGIHLIVATQRPSVDVITGLIKANIPARIAFAVSSQVDSRTILDGGGAEKLLGMGDMLFLPLGASKPIRVQGTYVRDEEISRVIEFVKRDFVAEYNQEMIENMEKLSVKDKGGSSGSDDGGEARDEMLPKAIEVVVEAGQASTSLLQRRLKLGYARAARIMDEMESMGIIGPYEGSKPRQVLITKNQWLEMTLSQGE